MFAGDAAEAWPDGRDAGAESTGVGVRVERLSDVSLEDSTGAHRRLGDYWAERPVVLVFLRHFG
jgi:hypothetical protein